MKNGFEEISHTADTGIRARAATLSGVLEQAAEGMFSLILPRPPALVASGSEELRFSARTGEELLHALLSELLYLHGIRRSIPVDYVLSAVAPGHDEDAAVTDSENLEATGSKLWRCEVTCTYAEMTRDMQVQATEIKAVTWHGLTLRFDNDRWQAEVIFDT